jgi:lipopolysaccharide export system protein LptA
MLAGVLSTRGDATSCVTNASCVAVEVDRGVGVTSGTDRLRAGEVSVTNTAGAGEAVGVIIPPGGVGVAY